MKMPYCSAWENALVLMLPQWTGGQFHADAGWFLNARLTNPAASASHGFYRVLPE